MIDGIRALHKKVPAPAKFYGDKDSFQCAEDKHSWPCATIRLLDAGDPKADAHADALREDATARDAEANRYGDRGGDHYSPFLRDIADTIDRLSGRKRDG